ncbi:hypothetical protein D3C76_896320 [compost metagenome]
MDDVDRLGGHLGAVEFLGAEQFHVRNQAARAYAHDQAAAAEMVELGNITGDGGRVVLRQVEYASGELDVLGGVEQGGEELQRVGHGLRAATVVLANPDFAEAQLVGEDRGFAVLLQHFGVVTPRIVQRHHEQTEFHSISWLRLLLVVSTSGQPGDVWSLAAIGTGI